MIAYSGFPKRCIVSTRGFPGIPEEVPGTPPCMPEAAHPPARAAGRYGGRHQLERFASRSCTLCLTTEGPWGGWLCPNWFPWLEMGLMAARSPLAG